METVHGKNEIAKVGKKARRKVEKVADTATDAITTAEATIQERVDDVKDLVSDLKERAELAIQEKPYLLPVATGALGLGVGVLIGSKLTRFLAVAAAGALLSDQVRGQLVRLGREVLSEIDQGDLGKGEAHADLDEAEDLEPSVT